MKPITWKHPLGNELVLLKGTGDSVYFIDSLQKDKWSEPKIELLSLKAMRELISKVDKDD